MYGVSLRAEPRAVKWIGGPVHVRSVRREPLAYIRGTVPQKQSLAGGYQVRRMLTPCLRRLVEAGQAVPIPKEKFCRHCEGDLLILRKPLRFAN
jgi:hypothetical protein